MQQDNVPGLESTEKCTGGDFVDICALSKQAHRQSEASEMQVVAMAGRTRRRYSIVSHRWRWDEGNLYRARKRMRVAHMEWNYGYEGDGG